jgi:predicted restriction endonuclease
VADVAHVEEYARLFAHLRVNVSRVDYPDTLHRSPNKPLLLLAMLDLFSEGGIPDGRVTLSPMLGELFSQYWYRVVPPDHRPNLALPFFHLHRDGGFWRLIATPGNEHALEQIQRTGQIRSVSVLSELVAYAQLDSRLVRCLVISSAREALRDVLIRTYFSLVGQARLREQAEVNAEAYDYSNRLLAQRIVAEAQSVYDLRPVARSRLQACHCDCIRLPLRYVWNPSRYGRRSYRSGGGTYPCVECVTQRLANKWPRAVSSLSLELR